MKRSIRTRLFIMVGLLIISFVLLAWLFNSNFLESYYMGEKRHQLAKNAEYIASIYKGDPYEISLELEKVDNRSSLDTIIMNQNYELKYPVWQPNLQGVPGGHRPGPSNGRLEAIINYVRSNRSLLDQQDVFALTQDARLNVNFLNLITRLDNGDYLLLSTPLSPIQESAAIANRFFLFSGLFIIIIGLVPAYFLARRFTRPIMRLNSIAQKMSSLDFSEKYELTTDDEIGELGKSINSLSDQLDKAINDLTQANLQLQADIDYERRLDETRKEFISSVSHELKTPIALIQGYAEGLKLNVAEDEASKNFYCEVITDEARKMNLIVRDLLDLSHYESGYFKIERTVFDFSFLLDQVMNKYQPLFSEKQIAAEIDKTTCDPVLMVDGDSLRIEQVLVNYINNAVNYMDDRRRLVIKLMCREDKVRVSVYNSGSAIPEEALDKIFTSFYKVDKARTRTNDGGSGLGLSIVAAIQNQHHNGYGVVNLEDGVEFWFEMDLAQPD